MATRITCDINEDNQEEHFAKFNVRGTTLKDNTITTIPNRSVDCCESHVAQAAARVVDKSHKVENFHQVVITKLP